eukprot:COSAG05_NODE_11_length_38500_cov_831.349861_12_plen_88_part_00
MSSDCLCDWSCVSLAAVRMDVWAGKPEVVEYKIQMECQKAVQMCTTMKECARVTPTLLSATSPFISPLRSVCDTRALRLTPCMHDSR